VAGQSARLSLRLVMSNVDVERFRKAKDEKVRREVWERQNEWAMRPF